MSASPKMLAMDLEKGRPSVGSSTPTFVLPQRRRKLIIVSLLLFAVLFFVYANERNGSTLSSGSWKWVKDSMRPALNKEDLGLELQGQNSGIADGFASQMVSPPSPLTPEHDKEKPSPSTVIAANDSQYEPTAALIHLAEEMNIPLPTSSTPLHNQHAGVSAPSHSDQILLFLSAMKNTAYKVPILKVQRTEQLLPASSAAFVDSLNKLQGSDTEDGKLYIESHPAWLDKHRSQSPLTVFSKSYCPYSRKAKNLLTAMGAHFDVYEVDLRDDAHSLQEGLRELSGHSTFPTIFVKDELIGGSDDLARLQNVGVLAGVLEAAGVKFNR